MTVIAWDGKTLASDKLASALGLRTTITKIFRYESGLFGSAGTGSRAAEMFKWVSSGADPDKIPPSQLTDDHQDVIVISKEGIYIYAQSCVPFKVENTFYAIGCGRDFAMAAMSLGLTSKEAVELTCKLSVDCGNGIDTLTL